MSHAVHSGCLSWHGSKDDDNINIFSAWQQINTTTQACSRSICSLFFSILPAFCHFRLLPLEVIKMQVKASLLLYFSTFHFHHHSSKTVKKQSRAFSLRQSPAKCHSLEFQMLKISSSVFISYLHKSQNRIPLRGTSPTVCFKCKTNKFLTRVLRFRFGWKCWVNQMWKYQRVMNISS